jgi:membrane protein implicated in regulation of membrane protease activity
MDFSIIEIVYLVAFFLGLGFAVLSALLSDVFHSDAAIGDIDVHPAGPDVDLGQPHGIHTGGVHFPILSPVTISTFVASFGGMGIILLKLKPEWGTFVHIPISIVVGLGVALSTAYLFYRLFGKAQISSAAREADIIGLEADVSITIPANGMGQISYVAIGGRATASAKSDDGSEVKQGEKVRIMKIAGGVYTVQKIR